MPTIALDQRQLPGAARRAVSLACRRAATGPVCAEAAALLTSEVVTNAMVHGRGEVSLSVDTCERVVHVEVGDDDPRRPELADLPAEGASGPAGAGSRAHEADPVDQLSEGGRGMRIVAVLASAWGVRDRRGGGKSVWFEVPVHP